MQDGKILVDILALSMGTEPPSSDTTLPFLRFLDKYVSCVPGLREISKFYKENPRMTLLDKLTASDIAYTVLVYENTFAVWDENRAWKGMTRADRDANPKVAVQKYFKKSGSKNKKYQNGWTKAGIDYYDSLVVEFKALAANGAIWDVLKDHWRQYSKEHSKYYYDDDDDLEDMEGEAADDDDEDDDGYVLDLPNLAAVGDTISASGTNEVDAAMIIQGMGRDSF